MVILCQTLQIVHVYVYYLAVRHLAQYYKWINSCVLHPIRHFKQTIIFP